MRQKEASSRVGKAKSVFFNLYTCNHIFKSIFCFRTSKGVFQNLVFSWYTEYSYLKVTMANLLFVGQPKEKKCQREGTHSDQEEDGQTQWFWMTNALKFKWSCKNGSIYSRHPQHMITILQINLFSCKVRTISALYHTGEHRGLLSPSPAQVTNCTLTSPNPTAGSHISQFYLHHIIT